MPSAVLSIYAKTQSWKIITKNKNKLPWGIEYSLTQTLHQLPSFLNYWWPTVASFFSYYILSSHLSNRDFPKVKKTPKKPNKPFCALYHFSLFPALLESLLLLCEAADGSVPDWWEAGGVRGHVPSRLCPPVVGGGTWQMCRPRQPKRLKKLFLPIVRSKGFLLWYLLSWRKSFTPPFFFLQSYTLRFAVIWIRWWYRW